MSIDENTGDSLSKEEMLDLLSQMNKVIMKRLCEHPDEVLMDLISRKGKDSIFIIITSEDFRLALLKNMGLEPIFEKKPSHMEFLKACLCDTIIPAIGKAIDSNGEVKIGFEDNNIFKIRIANRTNQDDYELRIGGNEGYCFKENHINTISGSKTYTVSGLPDSISCCLEISDKVKTVKSYLKKSLNREGLITKEQLAREDQSGVNKTILRRNGNRIYLPDGKTVSWNGNPLSLNRQEPSEKEKRANVERILKKYPNVADYYKKVFGGFGDDEKCIIL